MTSRKYPSNENVTIESLRFIRDIILGHSAYSIAKDMNFSNVSSITRKVNSACSLIGIPLFEKGKRGEFIPTDQAKKKLDVLNSIIENYELLCKDHSDNNP